jgi:hypothetical protein
MMDENYNKLTPAETERLSMLAEEAAEIIQIVGKILRHGYDSYHPDDPEMTSNRRLLCGEIEDLHAVLYGMRVTEDIPRHVPTPPTIDLKWKRKLKYSHHQGTSK